jgi:GT2 family glycosyltransferase
MSQPRCSIIVPVFNQAPATRRCVDSLLERRASIPHEIVVIDDASSDETPALLAEYGSAIRVVTHERNGGFARSCNDGAAAAEGDYLVFLNNNTLPEPGWLDALVAYANAHARAAVVGSKLLYPNDTIQHAGVVISHDLQPRHLYLGFPSHHPAPNKSRRFQVVTAACALMRRSAFEQAGGFDDGFVNGFEDVDLCLRLGKAGLEVHYCHESVLYHLESATRAAESLPNLELYLRRWGPRLRPDELDYYIEDGLLTLRYRQPPPHELEVSPLVAIVDAERQDLAARGLVNIRSRQVFELLQENVRLRLGAERAPSEPETTPAERNHRAVLLVSGGTGDAKRYRCDHQAEQLELSGLTTEVETYPSAVLDDSAAEFDCFVLHRVPCDERVAAFLEEARRLRKPLVFDTDDLLFDLEARPHISGLSSMRGPEREHMLRSIESQRETLLACDAVLVSTEPLQEAAAKLHTQVFMRPNTVSMEMVAHADAALARRHVEGRDDGAVMLAYLSGTPTHDWDFLEAAEGVLSALDRNENVRLLTVGHVTLDPRFERFREQVQQIPFQPWSRLPDILASVDINLAPLQNGNPFAAAKSCLKYLEAALVGVPTVASPRSDFVRAIEHGSNGLLAEAPEDWEIALDELIASAERRREIGRSAFADVRGEHTTRAAGDALSNVLRTVARAEGEPRRSELTAAGAGRQRERGDRADDHALRRLRQP